MQSVCVRATPAQNHSRRAWTYKPASTFPSQAPDPKVHLVNHKPRASFPLAHSPLAFSDEASPQRRCFLSSILLTTRRRACPRWSLWIIYLPPHGVPVSTLKIVSRPHRRPSSLPPSSPSATASRHGQQSRQARRFRRQWYVSMSLLSRCRRPPLSFGLSPKFYLFPFPTCVLRDFT